MEKNIRNVLHQLHLSEGEISVYIALIKLGLSTTGSIMKHADISNSKVYEVLDKLVKKGLASYVIQNSKRHYAAAPAERLVTYLEEQKQAIESNQRELQKLIPSLERLRNEKELPEAIIYRGRKGALIALNDTLKFSKKSKELSVGFGSDDYPTHFPAQMEEYSKIAKKYKFNQKLIFAEGFKSPNTNAKKRYLPKEYNLPVRTMVYGNTVAIVDFVEPMTTIIINKKSVADTYRTHFNILWKLAKP